jgi:hypothetical protein
MAEIFYSNTTSARNPKIPARNPFYRAEAKNKSARLRARRFKSEWVGVKEK